MSKLNTAIILLLSIVLITQGQSPLFDYVKQPDLSYSYEHRDTLNGDNVTGYLLHMISQAWLTPKDTSNSVWDHLISICVPDQYKSGNSVSFILDGGNNNEELMLLAVCELAKATNTITARISGIPNQPISFESGTVLVQGEALVAYTYNHFLNDTSSPFWIIQLPMTKAVVRGMDTIQNFLSSLLNPITINNFVLTGLSQQGFVAWTTAIVDSRVTAIVPINIPMLNTTINFNTFFQAYGNWTLAWQSFSGVLHQLNTPQFQQLQAIIDPLSYLDRLNFSKYIVCALGDEYFLPDATRYFYNALPGSNYLRLVPNITHNLEPLNLGALAPILVYTNAIVTNSTLPQFTWNLVRSINGTASIIVNATNKPTSIKLLKAHTISNTMRDFRLEFCTYNIEWIEYINITLKNSSGSNSTEIDISGNINIDTNSSNPNCTVPVFWYEEDLQDQGNGSYVAKVDAPTSGWIGFVVELRYDTPSGTLKFSTDANIVPDRYPFSSCGNNC